MWPTQAAPQDGGRQETPAYRMSQLEPGHSLDGPAILLDEISTTVVEPGCKAYITGAGDVRIDVLQGAADKDLDPDTCDPVQLGIFSHRQEAHSRGQRGLVGRTQPPPAV